VDQVSLINSRKHLEKWKENKREIIKEYNNQPLLQQKYHEAYKDYQRDQLKKNKEYLESLYDYFNYNKKIKIYNANEIETTYYEKDIIVKTRKYDDEMYPKKKQKKKKQTEEDIYNSIKNSQNRTIQKIYDYARSNEWEYFITLTFNPEKVDSFNYAEVTKKLSTWINNLKKKDSPNLKYIVVPELHESGRYHFHGLIANIGELQLIDSHKRTKSDEVIYNIGQYKLGFTTATEVIDNQRVSTYITKYITKDMVVTTKGKKRYWNSKNLKTPIIQKNKISEEQSINQQSYMREICKHSKVIEVPVLEQVINYYVTDQLV